MVKIGSIQLPKIGSITRDGAKFVVGPLVETSSGLYSPATEFYSTILWHYLKPWRASRLVS